MKKERKSESRDENKRAFQKPHGKKSNIIVLLCGGGVMLEPYVRIAVKTATC